MRDVWRRALLYFGLAEEDDYEEFQQDYDDYEDLPYRDRPTVKKIQRGEKSERLERTERGATIHAISTPQVRVHIIEPKSFNDAQRVADKFRANTPVIVNLQTTETELSKRLIDFASGLTYGLNGGMQKVADKVFLLTPSNIEVSAEEKRRLQEKGFFNQL